MKGLLLFLIFTSFYCYSSDDYYEVGHALAVVEAVEQGHQFRLTGEREEFEVKFPWAEQGELEQTSEGEIRYYLINGEGYPVHYLVAYLTTPATKSVKYPILYQAPSMGLNALHKLRDRTVQAMVNHLRSLVSVGYRVEISSSKKGSYPAKGKGAGALGQYYEYEAKVKGSDGKEVEMRFRIYLTKEGIYLVAAMGQGFTRYQPARYLSGARDRLWWGRYHPDHVFDSIELNIAE